MNLILYRQLNAKIEKRQFADEGVCHFRQKKENKLNSMKKKTKSQLHNISY